MITAYVKLKHKIEKVQLKPGDPIPKGSVWLDLLEPAPAEEKSIEKALIIDAPTQEEMDKIEITSPFYQEGAAHYMTVTVLHRSDSLYPESTAITFILTKSILVTLRYSKPRPFENFAARAKKYPSLCSSAEVVLEGLVEAMVHRIADVLEGAGNRLDKLLKTIFEQSTTNQESSRPDSYNDIIKNIGHMGNLISKNRESLVSLSRLLIYFSQIDEGKYMAMREHRIRFRHLSREIQSLSEYANFLSQRNSFLLDATLGMISVEQSMITKIFTVAAAVFMPPTLIASIYGMNFKYMPEIELLMGYPMALILIVVSALLPYFYFKRKGWL